jgi:hypothetical protein
MPITTVTIGRGTGHPAFRALHAAGPFVIPNPWDAGSVRVLKALGFQAFAATKTIPDVTRLIIETVGIR